MTKSQHSRRRGSVFALILALVAGLGGSSCVAQLQTLTARVSIKRVLGPGGAFNPAWTSANLSTWIAQTNTAYAKSGVQFQLTEFSDLPDPGTPQSWYSVIPTGGNVLAMETAAKANPAAYLWRDNAINVYLANSLGGLGGVCSFATFNTSSQKDIIIVVPNILNGGIGLAHELGHYMDLLHTFETALGTETVATCPNQAPNGATAGDLIADTPPDDQVLANTTANYACSTPWFNALRFNVMSYYSGITSGNAVLTPGQCSVIYKTAKEYRRGVFFPFRQEQRKVLITEVSGGDPDCLEIKNFGLVTADLTQWRVAWKELGTTKLSNPLGIALSAGQMAVVREQTGASLAVPAGVLTVTGWFQIVTGSNYYGVALVDENGATVDEVRVRSATGTYDDCGLGGYFSGLAIPGGFGAADSVERIWGLDSDSGADWTAQSSRTIGYESSSYGPRGTDLRPAFAVRLNEIDDDPDFVELLVGGTVAVDLQHWALWGSVAHGSIHDIVAPFPASFRAAPGTYVVLGESVLAPTEFPFGGSLYQQIPATENFPFSTQEFECGLYDPYGRCVDLVRVPKEGTRLVINHPRAPSAPNDFKGTAGRVTSPTAAIARINAVDTDRGSDWRGTTQRTMGFANAPTAAPAGSGHELDVRLNRGSGAGGFTMILNAGAGFAGYRYSFLPSFTHNYGTGPFFGLGGDAISNYYALAAVPGFFGTLDANGVGRLDLPNGAVPPGIGTDNIFLLQSPSGALVALTEIIQYDS